LRRRSSRWKPLVLYALVAWLPQTLPAETAEADGPEPAVLDELELCAAMENEIARLACYDALAAGQPPPPSESYLERHWDLRDQGKRFRPWPHRPVYVLPARWTDAPNTGPFQELAAATGDPERVDVQPVETKFQISFKTKLLDDFLGGPGDLWFGFTQQSHFQIYNNSASRPFRETDYEPEVMLTFPTRRNWGKWSWRMAGLGVVHQSNGRSEPLSRSWNRIYAVVAGERGPVSIELRPWVRFDSTDPEDDDNPGIADFVGRMEALVVWQPGRQRLVFRGRSNLELDESRGSLAVDWFFPIRARLRGQLQLFTGYGESLIDYDHRQTTVGLGLLLFDPF